MMVKDFHLTIFHHMRIRVMFQWWRVNELCPHCSILHSFVGFSKWGLLSMFSIILVSSISKILTRWLFFLSHCHLSSPSRSSPIVLLQNSWSLPETPPQPLLTGVPQVCHGYTHCLSICHVANRGSVFIHNYQHAELYFRFSLVDVTKGWFSI